MQKVGCSNCEYGWKAFREGLKPCPDAFTEVAQYCGAYDNNEINIFKEGSIDGSSRTETADKE